jgi:hypothetical protein
MCETIIRSMRHRKLYGCLFLLPVEGGASVFASSTPEGTVKNLTAGEQLTIFAQVASTAESEQQTTLTPDENDWVN